MNSVTSDLHFGIGVDNTNKVAKQKAKRKAIHSKVRKVYTLSSKTMTSKGNKKDKLKFTEGSCSKSFVFFSEKNKQTCPLQKAIHILRVYMTYSLLTFNKAGYKFWS